MIVEFISEYIESLTFHDVIIIITFIAAVWLVILIYRKLNYLNKVNKTAKFYLDVREKIKELENEKK